MTTAKAAARPSVGKPTSDGGRFSDSTFGRAAGLPVVIPTRCRQTLTDRASAIKRCMAVLFRANHSKCDLDYKAQDVGQYIVTDTNPHCEGGIGFAYTVARATPIAPRYSLGETYS